MITRQHLLDKYKEWDLTLIPLSNDTKKPISKFTGEYDDDGKQIWSWKKRKGITYSDKELLAARRWGVDHEASGTMDADFDDSALHAHKFIGMLPDTFTIGKKYNGSGIPTANHKLFFKPKDVKIKSESYGKSTDSGCIIELLPNTQSHYFGDRDIINDIPPKRLTESEFQQVRQTVKEIYFLAMASRNYPKAGGRDEYIMRLAGVMALHTDWSISKREDYLSRLLHANNDTDEINNRLEKIKKQENKFKEGEDVYGIPALVKFLKADAKVGLDWIDAIKKGNEEKEEKRYPLVNARQFVTNKYPEPKFLMFPIFSERSANQIFGGYESGKTIFGLAVAMHMCSKADFVEFESKKMVPTAYVEGELPAAKVRERFNSILMGMKKRGINFNFDWFHILTKDDLAMHGFKYGFESIAVSRNLSAKDAEDYGRKGRKFISNWIRDIEKRLGQPPFFFLDNITALADIDENLAKDWTPFIQWITHEKNKGFANCFMHHSNKQNKGKGSSGSTAKERLLDTSMEFEKLDAKHRFEMSGDKNVQCKVHFDKARDFGGSQHDKDLILTMTEEGKWTRYPYLDQYDFIIIKLHKQGMSVKDMAEHEALKKKLEEKTIYTRVKKLKDIGIIK